MLSDESKQMRRRRNSINIKITLLSWILEFISGMFILVVRRLRKNDYLSARMMNWMVFIDVFLYFVVIPCTYVLNREVTKRIIIMENWYQGIKSIFFGRHSSNSGTEPPAQPPPPREVPLSRYLSGLRNMLNRKTAPTPLVIERDNEPQSSASGMDTPPRQAALSLDIVKLHRNFQNRISGKVASSSNAVSGPLAQLPSPVAVFPSRSLSRIGKPLNRKIAPTPLVVERNNQHQSSVSGMDTPPRQPALTLDISKLQCNFQNRICGKVAPLPENH